MKSIASGFAALFAGIIVSATTTGAPSSTLDTSIPTITVGDGTVDGSRIVPYDNAWKVTVRHKDGMIEDGGLATDHVTFKTIDGKKYLVRVEGDVQNDGTRSDTTVTYSDPLTLAPFEGQEFASDGSVVKRMFEGTHVVVRMQSAAKAKEEVRQFDLPRPVFDFRGNMAGLLLRAQPLAVGYGARVPWADPNGGMHATEIHVLRRETVDAGMKGRVETWVVAIGAAPSHVTYWIADEAPYVIKAEIRGDSDVTSWDMIR